MALKDYIVQEVALDCEEGLLSRREALRRLAPDGDQRRRGGDPARGVWRRRRRIVRHRPDDTGTADTGLADTGHRLLGRRPRLAPPTTPPARRRRPRTRRRREPTSTEPPAASAPPTGEEIRFSGPNGELIGVVAEASSPRGAVLVIHENRGLTPHIRSIPPRLAADGYTALAIDLLSEEGGTASLPSEGDATAALGNAPTERMIADLRAGLDELGRRAPEAKLADDRVLLRRRDDVAAARGRRAATGRGGPLLRAVPRRREPRRLTERRGARHLRRPRRSRQRHDGSRRGRARPRRASRTSCACSTVSTTPSSTTPARATTPTAAAEAYQAMLDWFAQHLAA